MSDTTNWGVPDWKDPSAYPIPTGPNRLVIWAWEFLRRNDDYRSFWKTNIRPFIDPNGFIVGGQFDLEQLRERFGVENPAPPEEASPPIFVDLRTRYMKKNDRRAQVIELGEHELAFFVDLRRPINPQITRIVKIAKHQQEKKQTDGLIDPKSSPELADKFVLYLRILDADAARADPKEIETALIPNIDNIYPSYLRSKTLSNSRKAARRMRDSGYRNLAAIGLRP